MIFISNSHALFRLFPHKSSGWLTRCVDQNIEDRRRREESRWEKRVEVAINNIGFSREEIVRLKEEGQVVGEILKRRVNDITKQERRAKIADSRYNTWFKEIPVVLSVGTPRYLLSKLIARKDQILLARFRCGNEVRNNEYWKETKDKKCRLCGKEEETEEHIFKKEGCEKMRSIDDQKEGIEDFRKYIKQLLQDDGSGMKKLREIKNMREEMCEKKLSNITKCAQMKM